MSRSNDRLNASVLLTTRLSTTVHGATLVTCTAAYCDGSLLRAIHAFTPSAYAPQVRLGLGRQHRQAALGGAPQPERPQLDIAGQRAAAEQFGERARPRPAANVHLEQPIVGVDPALQEEQVMRILRLDVSDPVVVTDHGRGRAQAGNLDQVCDIRVPAGRRCHGERSGGEDADGEQSDARSAHHLSTPNL